MGKFILKLVVNGVIVVALLLWLTDATFWGAAVSAVILSVIAYYLGDRMILPATNNITATVADFGLAFIYYWAIGTFLNWRLSFSDAFGIALAVALAEMWLHTIMTDGNRRRAKV